MSSIWTPRRDQQHVLDWLQPRARGAVWAGTGSGKTVMSLTWLAQRMDDCLVSRALIVAPKLVAQHGWPLQARLWRHVEHLGPEMRVLTFADLGLARNPGQSNSQGQIHPCERGSQGQIHPCERGSQGLTKGAGANRVAAVSGNGGLDFRDKRATKSHLRSLTERIHVCSWDAFPWLAKAYGSNWPYDCVVFDESSFLRDQQSERGKAARHVVHRSGVVEHVLELTASPAANHQEAIFAQLDLIERGLLGSSLTDFRDTFCVPESRNWSTGQVYSWRVASSMAAEFQRRCASVAVSVPASLGVPLVEAPVWVTLPDASRAAYDALERDQVWGGITAGSAAVLHSKLRQMASGFVYDDADGVQNLDTVKLDRLEELIEEVSEPVLVAYEFVEELARLRQRFGKHVAEIRDAGARDAFEAGKLRILALHPMSAGHGVDGLQRVCRHVIWTTVPQDRELFDQTNGRVHRHGTQAETVYCHLLVARGTREEDVWREVLPGKMSVQDLLLRAARVAA